MIVGWVKQSVTQQTKNPNTLGNRVNPKNFRENE